MVVFKAFDLTIYNLDKINSLADVVTQPYDKISPQMQNEYYNKSEHNITRIIKNKAEIQNDSYLTASYYLDEWLKSGILKKFGKPAYLYLEQEFTINEKSYVRKALIGLGQLHDYTENKIFPHEQTLKGPKADRLKLLQATSYNFGQIFMLYRDPENLINKTIQKLKDKKLFASFIDPDLVKHTLYFIDDKKTINLIEKTLEDKKFFIADGHHRYETSLAFAKETGKNFIMMSVINACDEGLLILPTHRLIKKELSYDFENLLLKLEDNFNIKKYSLEEYSKNIYQAIDDLPIHSMFFTAKEDTNNIYELSFKNHLPKYNTVPNSLKELDVFILHKYILEDLLGISEEDMANNTYVTYKRNPADTIKDVHFKNDYTLAFLLKPIQPEQLFTIAEDKLTMPQKSTDFYPKLLTGYAMADLNSL